MLDQPVHDVRLAAADQPVIDSAMTEEEAFDGLDPNCQADIRSRQKIVPVLYYSFDSRIHRGQLVIDGELEDDVLHVFALALEVRFPIHCVVPISHPRFRIEDRWDDAVSMAANNTSAFNYRTVIGSPELSAHADGRAIDINPMQNPYFKDKIVLPAGAKYDATAPGTLTADHPVVRAFLDRGWHWGGNWQSLRDYQHFEKRSLRSPFKRSLLWRFYSRVSSKLAGNRKQGNSEGVSQ